MSDYYVMLLSGHGSTQTAYDPPMKLCGKPGRWCAARSLKDC